MFLVFLLGISGMSFMHLDFLERKTVLNEVGNHGAFYLGNAGLERAREVLKIPIINDNPTWTPVLNDSDPNHPAGYVTENPPDPLLCPDPSHGCEILPFGATVSTPGLGFEGTFDDGSYNVRVFNDAAESGTVDTNGILTLRASGLVRGDRKILEATILATSGLNLINCQGNVGDVCPNSKNKNTQILPSSGREPASTPTLPYPDPALTAPNNYYLDPAHFGLTSCTYTGTLQNGCHYVISGDVTLSSTGTHDRVVVFSYGKASVQGNTNLSNAIIVGVNEVQLQGNVTLRSPLPNPAIISSGTVKGDNSVQVYGTIYTSGKIELNPIQVHGVLIGKEVKLKGASTLISDDGNLAYYAFMPGFWYPPEMKTTVTTTGSWREIQ